MLINNAGVSSAAPATRETPEEFRRVIDINLNGSYWMVLAASAVYLASDAASYVTGQTIPIDGGRTIA